MIRAWSVVERMVGRAPAAGPSAVARRLGAFGELLVVLLANAVFGTLLAGLIRWTARLLR